MFVALKPLTESSRVGPPIEHVPGDVLERWAEWPYRVRVALLHAEMAEERPDVMPLAPAAPNAQLEPIEPHAEVAIDTLYVSRETSVSASDTAWDVEPTSMFNCSQCDRTDFANEAALKRHVTRKHS